MIRFGQAHQAELAINGKGKMPYKMNDWKKKNLSAECGGGTLNYKTDKQELRDNIEIYKLLFMRKKLISRPYHECL